MSPRRNTFLRAALVGAVVSLLTAALPNAAKAALTLEVTGWVSNSSNTTVTSFTEGPATSGAFPSFVQLFTPDGTIGGITLQNGGATHTASDPGTPQHTGPTSILNSVLNQLTNGADVRNATIVVSATGFTLPAPGGLSLTLDGRWSNASGSSVTANWYMNSTNQLATISSSGVISLNGSTQVGTTFVNTAADNSGHSYSNEQRVNAPFSTTPYGMSLIFTLHLTPSAQLQNRGQALEVSAVPEPTTVVTAFSGLPILGLLWARRRRRRQA